MDEYECLVYSECKKNHLYQLPMGSSLLRVVIRFLLLGKLFHLDCLTYSESQALVAMNKPSPTSLPESK